MHELDDQALQHVASYFAALAVPVRLKILNALRDGELNVTELTTRTRCTQANVSKHLAVLARHGLLQRSARGTSAYYRIAEAGVYKLCDIVCGQLEKRFEREAPMTRSFSRRSRSSPKRRRGSASTLR